MNIIKKLKEDFPNLAFVSKLETDNNKCIYILYVNNKKMRSQNIEALLNEFAPNRKLTHFLLYEQAKKDINNFLIEKKVKIY